MNREVEEFRLERKVPYLLHFTQASNIPSIMAHGLVPRASLNCGEVTGETNDDLRLDGRPNFNSLSIAFPNAPMFHRFKQENLEIEWPILVINPIVMARQNSLFCWKNAACNEFSQTADEELTGVEAFRTLYAENPEVVSREEQLLKICDPTHVQAEVMIEGVIPPNAIYSIIFPSVPCMDTYRHYTAERKLYVSNRRGFYGTRDYYRRWGTGK